MQGTNRKTSGESKRFFSPLGLRFPVCFVRTATPRPRGTSAFANACTFTLHIFSSPLLYPPAPQLSIRFLHIIFFPRFLPFVDNVRKTLGLCHKAKTLGLCPKPCLGDFLRRSPLRTFKTFNAIGFMSLSFRCANSDVAISRATNSGCSAPNPVQRDWQGGYCRSLRYRIKVEKTSGRCPKPHLKTS